MNIEETVQMMLKFFCDQPCNYNDMDEIATEDEWCEKHCGGVDEAECWKHAIEEKWWENA